MFFEENYITYKKKIVEAFRAHDIVINNDHFDVSPDALSKAEGGDWIAAVEEFKIALENILKNSLTSDHEFLKNPYVRDFYIEGEGKLSVAIVNKQSLEWYGRDGAEAAFDFILESRRGLFRGCNRFLDLGGHQMIWACFYARSSPGAFVVSYEPSILNVAIGLFNCFLNGVINSVDIVPFAVLATNSAVGDENSKMLVDFMTVPLRGQKIDMHCKEVFDFVKTDIEGYELELLDCAHYVHILKNARCSHLELHLGHLYGRGIGVDAWINKLKTANISGVELYSGRNMYDFLENADPKGYYSFVLN